MATLNQDWDESSILDLCQNFLSQLPEDKRLKLLAPYVPKYPYSPNATPNSTQPATPIHLDPVPSLQALDKNEERLSRGRSKGSPSSRLKTRTDQSGSRKRRQVGHADQDMEVSINSSAQRQLQIQSENQQKQYETLPVFVQNSLPMDIKSDPKKLEQILKSMKPEAKIKSLFICKSGDIKLIAQTPHDENILRQTWNNHEIYGQFKPRLPKEKTASHEVTILNLPTCITNQEINDKLKENMMSPKDIFRFNKKGTQEPSRNVKVTLGSKMEKDKLIAHGFSIYSQHFRAEETKPLPSVLQCYKCQKFGHNFYECKESESKCLRCGGNHRLAACTLPKANAKCANCSESHAANFKGCPAFKEAQKTARETEIRNKVSQPNKITSSYAAAAAPIKPKEILACLAECLSELVSLFNDSMKKSQPLDDMQPFKIVASAAARQLNIHLDANEILMKVISPTPAPSPVKPSAPPETSSPDQSCLT